jgi:DnaJ-class molecular chaperone
VLGDDKLKRQYDAFGEHAISRSAARDASSGTTAPSPSYCEGQRELQEKQCASIRRDKNSLSAEQAAGVDFYEVLGVSKDSGPEVIKQAYIMLVKLYHPGKDVFYFWSQYLPWSLFSHEILF